MNPAFLFPSKDAARTMRVAFYGNATWNRPLGEDLPDAYGLFYARSLAMGWLSAATLDWRGGVWGMNDAQAFETQDTSKQVAWFQVALIDPATSSLLPAQQLLTCARDVISRLGTLELTAVEVSVPWRDLPAEGIFVAGSNVRAPMQLLDARNWFGGLPRQARVATRVTLEGGPDASLQMARPQLLRSLTAFRDVFETTSTSPSVEDDVVLSMGSLVSNSHPVTFAGTLVEWTAESLGYLVTLFADMCARCGMYTPFIFSATREPAR